MDFAGGSSGQEPACQCRRHKKCRFDSWFGKIPWRRSWWSTPVFFPGESRTEEPGELQSMGSQRVRHDWSDLACMQVYIYICVCVCVCVYLYFGASLLAQSVKNLPAVQETWVRSLGWEDPLEKEMATHYSILAWKFSWTEEPGGLQSMRSQRVGHDWATNTTNTYLYFKYVIFKDLNNWLPLSSCIFLLRF